MDIPTNNGILEKGEQYRN